MLNMYSVKITVSSFSDFIERGHGMIKLLKRSIFNFDQSILFYRYTCQACPCRQRIIKKQKEESSFLHLLGDVCIIFLRITIYIMLFVFFLQFVDDRDIADFFGKLEHYFRNAVEFESVTTYSRGPVY